MKLSFNCAQIIIIKCKSEKIKFEKSMDGRQGGDHHEPIQPFLAMKKI
jgi:hypothetical protein